MTFNFDVNVNVTVTCPQLDTLISQQTAIQAQLTTVLQGVKTLMAKQEDELKLIKQIDDATSAQSAVLVTEAQTLQTISDRGKAILAQLQNGDVPASVMDALGSLFDHTKGVSDSLTKQAEFSDQVAKDLDNVVPVPVPDPAPVPPGPAPTA